MKPCSECGAEVPKAARRPRETCPGECVRKRHARIKREARDWKRKCAEAEAANAAYLKNEFDPWARGEGWPESKPTPEVPK